MFKLLQPSKNFPQIKYVNLNHVQLYMMKFEESIKNLEEIQNEAP
jgi:hypothetical protein